MTDIEAKLGSELDKPYQLSITITRHGPKDGFEGRLSEQGKREIEQYYMGVYRGMIMDNSVPRKLVSSPIRRAMETAQIYERVMETYYNATPALLEEDERLSEHNIGQFKDQLPFHLQEDWFRYWYTAIDRPRPHIHIGKEAVVYFSSWFLEQIETQKKNGGSLRIDAFSHGPIMAAFILALEEMLDTTILSPLKDGQDRLNFDRLFSTPRTGFMYLSNINFYINSEHFNDIRITFFNKTITVPIAVIKTMIIH